jgi:AcrR family transcriptional regulator
VGVKLMEAMATTARRPYAARLPPEERREQLFDATLRVIARDGYGGVNIEAIAREAGVTRPVVYGLFENLGALLRELLQRQEQRALTQLAQAVPDDPGDRDPDQLLLDSMAMFLEAVAREPDTWRVILIPPEGTPAVVREHVERNRNAIRSQLEGLVSWGLERRGGPADLDVELVARTLQVAAEEAGRMILTEPDRYPPERLARYARAVLTAVQPS